MESSSIPLRTPSGDQVAVDRSVITTTWRLSRSLRRTDREAACSQRSIGTGVWLTFICRIRVNAAEESSAKAASAAPRWAIATRLPGGNRSTNAIACVRIRSIRDFPLLGSTTSVVGEVSNRIATATGPPESLTTSCPAVPTAAPMSPAITAMAPAIPSGREAAAGMGERSGRLRAQVARTSMTKPSNAAAAQPSSRPTAGEAIWGRVSEKTINATAATRAASSQ